MYIIQVNFISKLLRLWMVYKEKVVFLISKQNVMKDVVHVKKGIKMQHQQKSIIVFHVNHPIILWVIYVLNNAQKFKAIKM
jgi:hypothetical protein